MLPYFQLTAAAVSWTCEYSNIKQTTQSIFIYIQLLLLPVVHIYCSQIFKLFDVRVHI